jgi:glycosyltransferase involved in cell wall biosynthesis
MLQLVGYYPALQKVSGLSQREIAYVEKRAFTKASFRIFSSPWASDFVRKRFSVEAFTIPFGANLTELPNGPPLKKISPDYCTLIFVGVDWVRKGGDVVLAILRAIQKKGLKCRALIIGSSANIPRDLERDVVTVRSLDKVDQSDLYASHFQDSDFMVLPTMADCTPIVIAEAFAFGVPVLASNTGGISSMITNNVNGFLLSDRDPDSYAQLIVNVFNDRKKYAAMSIAGFESYARQFNWRKWAQDLIAKTKVDG